jgi:hypothetical protein
MYPQSLPSFLIPFLALITIWEIIWKLFALWKSARNGQKIWFISMLLLNTIGILPIVYLIIMKKREKEVSPSVEFEI